MRTPLIDRLRDEHTQARSDAIARYRQQLRPEALLTALGHLTDQTLQALVNLFALPGDAALAAVGGYGRGELYPHSDVDVLILLSRPLDEHETGQVERLIAAMWDVGLEPSHSVRTISDCRHEAANDVTVETALLEARWLAGNQPLLTQLREAMEEQMDVQAFFQAKRAEMQQRHARHQDTAYALEPNCKESPGGLRDLQAILWLTQAAGLGRTWHEVAETDLLTTTEFRSLRRADMAFKRLRIELHLLTGRCEDRVLFDLQPALARIYGFSAVRNRRGSEILMQRYYWAARVVSQLNAILGQSIEERLFPWPDEHITPIDDDFRIRRDRLDICRDDCFARNPALLLRAFLVMQEHFGLQGMSARMLRAMWHARRRIDTQFRRNPVNRHMFIQILQQPRGVMRALRSMSMLNILPRYLPVFRRIVGQMQHDLFHAYTVDQHILMVIRNLRRFTIAEHSLEYPLASQLIASFDRHWLLYVAALFHDIAKGRGGDHSELGAQEARRFCRDHSIEGEDASLIEFLVRQHLTMSMVAQKRDISDPSVVNEFAQCVGNERRLSALYLLTVADIRATSPKVWNSWKGKLLENLYVSTAAALGEAPTDTSTVLAQRRDTAIAAIRRAGIDDTTRTQLWKELDLAYFLRHEADEIAWHATHIAPRAESLLPIVKARAIGQDEALQIMVYVQDREDLFVTICRYFDERVLSVQDARVHTTQHGWALDSFIVLLPSHERQYDLLANRIEQDLARELEHNASTPRTRVGSEAPRRSPSRRARAFPMVPKVELQRDDSSPYWRLAITAADGPGLLYRLAKVFAAHRIDLKMAKIMTLGDRIEDVFIIEGEVLGNPRVQLQFERDILVTLDNSPCPDVGTHP